MLNKSYLQSKKYIYKISMNKPGKKIAVAPENLQYFTEWQKEGLDGKIYHDFPIRYSSFTK